MQIVKGPEKTDWAANSDGIPWWVKAAPFGAAILGWAGGWMAPDFFVPDWSNGNGDLRALGSAMAAVAAALLPGWAAKRSNRESHPNERLDQAVSGFKEAALCLAEFSSSDADNEQAEAVRQELSDVLARAVSFGGRKARLVVYFLERTESESSDAAAEGLNATESTYKRFFQYDCHSGRPDVPAHRIYSSGTGFGEFFCNQMLEREQVVIQNVNNPPREAKISTAEGAKYGSFIVTPVEGPDGEVRGAVSIDYPGRSRFDSFDCSVAWDIAKLFQDTFEATIKSAAVTSQESDEVLDQLEPEN